ncbi:MAG: DNA polymerase III subunit delta, partial [Cyanobacteria bacterium P01_A01_bin.40]
QQAGEKDQKAIASAAGINNPNRLYFINQEIQRTTSNQLLATLPQFLELEYSLKSGGSALTILQTKIIELCLIFQ